MNDTPERPNASLPSLGDDIGTSSPWLESHATNDNATNDAPCQEDQGRDEEFQRSAIYGDEWRKHIKPPPYRVVLIHEAYTRAAAGDIHGVNFPRIVENLTCLYRDEWNQSHRVAVVARPYTWTIEGRQRVATKTLLDALGFEIMLEPGSRVPAPSEPHGRGVARMRGRFELNRAEDLRSNEMVEVRPDVLAPLALRHPPRVHRPEVMPSNEDFGECLVSPALDPDAGRQFSCVRHGQWVGNIAGGRSARRGPGRRSFAQ